MFHPEVGISADVKQLLIAPGGEELNKESKAFASPDFEYLPVNILERKRH
jgi:hypothetical protein